MRTLLIICVYYMFRSCCRIPRQLSQGRGATCDSLQVASCLWLEPQSRQLSPAVSRPLWERHCPYLCVCVYHGREHSLDAASTLYLQLQCCGVATPLGAALPVSMCLCVSRRRALARCRINNILAVIMSRGRVSSGRALWCTVQCLVVTVYLVALSWLPAVHLAPQYSSRGPG